MTVRMGAHTTVNADEEQLVLLYLQNAHTEAAGFTTRDVMDGTGLDRQHAQRLLEGLYVKKLDGRQKALWGADQNTYWLPATPAALELRGLPDTPARPPTLCATCRQPTKGGRLCRSCAQVNGAVWDELDEAETKVMLLIDSYGDKGVPFDTLQGISREAEKALQSLQRQGIAGVDLQAEVWCFGGKGRAVCDDYKAHNP